MLSSGANGGQRRRPGLGTLGVAAGTPALAAPPCLGAPKPAFPPLLPGGPPASRSRAPIPIAPAAPSPGQAPLPPEGDAPQ